MKSILFLILQLILFQSVFAQDAPPSVPSESSKEIAERNAFIKTNQINNEVKGNMVLHSNKFFSLSCKNKGEVKDYKGYIWLLTSKVKYDKKEPEIVISGFEKQFYTRKSTRQELKYFGYNDTFDSWNLDKLGEYYFTFNAMKFPLLSNKNLSNANSISKSKIKIDGTEFIKYDFKVKIDGIELIESNYLTVIDNFVFIIHQRKYLNDKEDVIKTFKRKKA